MCEWKTSQTCRQVQLSHAKWAPVLCSKNIKSLYIHHCDEGRSLMKLIEVHTARWDCWLKVWDLMGGTTAIWDGSRHCEMGWKWTLGGGMDVKVARRPSHLHFSTIISSCCWATVSLLKCSILLGPALLELSTRRSIPLAGLFGFIGFFGNEWCQHWLFQPPVS